jgi:hypothetical protein
MSADESGSGPSGAKGIGVWIAIRIEESIAAGRQRIRRVARKRFLADFVHKADEDVGTDDRDRAVNSRRADGSGAGGMAGE